ncbi:MAG: hypothetical protein CL920_33585 [Deltaproteobacteria bacterium]|nr:hypothetical protein [Deltaproteobacteria bacterium]MBU53657.1 hypothetical protein [Deltaproteobacteria bacterium]
MMYAQKHKHTEPAPSERRREPRLPFKSNTVMLVTYKGGGPLYFGDCKTIDKQSLMMEVEHPVPPGKKIECKFTLPWTERSVYLQGIVMDVLPPKHQGGKSRMKVRFLSLDHNVLKSLDAYLQKKDSPLMQPQTTWRKLPTQHEIPRFSPNKNYTQEAFDETAVYPKVKKDLPNLRGTESPAHYRARTEPTLPVLPRVAQETATRRERMQQTSSYCYVKKETKERSKPRYSDTFRRIRETQPVPTVRPPANRHPQSSSQQANRPTRPLSTHTIIDRTHMTNPTLERATRTETTKRAPLVASFQSQHKDRMISVMTENISNSGIMLRTTDPLPKGAEIHIQLVPPGQSRGLWFQGCVAWSKEGVGMGISFANLSQQQRKLLALLTQER